MQQVEDSTMTHKQMALRLARKWARFAGNGDPGATCLPSMIEIALEKAAAAARLEVYKETSKIAYNARLAWDSRDARAACREVACSIAGAAKGR